MVNVDVECSVSRCDYQQDGYCTIVPKITDQPFDVQMSDEIVGDYFPVCQSIKTERKEKEYTEMKYAELKAKLEKRYGSKPSVA